MYGTYPVHAQSCGFLVNILVGCDVVLQETRIEQEKTNQVELRAAADQRIADAETAAVSAQAEADRAAAKYDADASIENARANERAQVAASKAWGDTEKVRAKYAYQAQTEVADSNNDAIVQVKQMETDTALKLGMLPWIGVAVILGMILFIAYRMYMANLEARVKMASYRVLPGPPDPYAYLTDWQRQYASAADRRGMTWEVSQGDFYFLRLGEWHRAKRPEQLTMRGE